MKLRIYLIALVCLGFFNSCTIEQEITELSRHEDYLLETVIFFEEEKQPYDVKFIYYKTDGYDNLIEEYNSYRGSTNRGWESFSKAIKEYKKIGVTLKTSEDRNLVIFNLREIGHGNSIFFQYISEYPGELTFFFDFETGEMEVIEGEMDQRKKKNLEKSHRTLD